MFNKGLKADKKLKGLLKRLKNIEDKTDGQLRAIQCRKDDQGIKSIGFNFKENLSPKGLRMFNQTVEKEKLIDYSYLYMNPSRRHTYDVRMFRKLKPLSEEIYLGRKAIHAIERDQNFFEQELKKLDNYGPSVEPNISKRKKFLENDYFYEGRVMIINAFKNRLFLFSSGDYYDDYAVSESEDSSSDNGP